MFSKSFQITSVAVVVATVSSASTPAVDSYTPVFDGMLEVVSEATPVTLEETEALQSKEDYLEACANACNNDIECASFSLRDAGENKYECTTHSKSETYGAWENASPTDKDIMYVKTGYTGCGDDSWYGHWPSDEGLFGAVQMGCHKHEEEAPFGCGGNSDFTNFEGGCASGDKCRVSGCVSAEEAANIDAEKAAVEATEEARQTALTSPDMTKQIDVAGYAALTEVNLYTSGESFVAVEELAGEAATDMSVEQYVQKCADACDADEECLLFGYVYTPDVPELSLCRLMTSTADSPYFQSVGAVLRSQDYTWNRFMLKEAYECDDDNMFNGFQYLAEGPQQSVTVEKVGCNDVSQERWSCGTTGDMREDFTNNNHGCATNLQCIEDPTSEGSFQCQPADYDADKDVYIVSGTEIDGVRFYVSEAGQVVDGLNDVEIQLTADQTYQEGFNQCAAECAKDDTCKVFEVVYDKDLCHLMSVERSDTYDLQKEDPQGLIGQKSM